MSAIEHFYNAIIRSGSEGTPKQYIHINPFLTFPVPPLDDVNSIPKLQKDVQDALRPKKKMLNDLANRLVACTFFFEKDIVFIGEEENQFLCKGRICYRFSNSSQRMRELGKYLGEFWTSDFNPYFLLCEPKKYAFETSQMIPISRNQINAMSQHGAFEAIGIDIKVSGLDSESMISLCLRKGDYQPTFSTEVYYDLNNFNDISISGFPRKLMTEDSLAKKNFRGLVSRVEDSYLEHTVSGTIGQLSLGEKVSSWII